MLDELIAIGDFDLSLETIRTLSGNSKLGEKILISMAMDKNKPIPIRAEAIAGLAAISSDHVELLLGLA